MASDLHRRRRPTTTIESLPNDLLSEILAKVGSSSMNDLCRLKTCSKHILNLIEEDDYIYQHVSMKEIPYVPWHITPQESSFLARCRKSRNPESLYREGMVQYFGPVMEHLDDDHDSGFKRLKEASQKGHREATYICGMILLCSEVEEERKQGVELLNFLRNLRCVKTCRNKVEECLTMMWKNDRVLTLFRNDHRERLCGSNMCLGLQETARLEREWPVLDEDEVISCDLCRWDYELRKFSKMCC